MSEYFSNFPKILYDIDGTNSTAPEFSTAINLLIRNKLREVVKGDISIYYPYVIPEEIRRPDVLSQNVYGDVSFTWTIFLVNNILDPLWQWPMDSRVFESYITRKYGSVGAAKTTVHHYEYTWHERVEATGTSDPIPAQKLEVDYDTYLGVNEDFREVIYNFEYEETKNEANREISLIQPFYISQVIDEARGLFR
tara:strand:+ start:8819 stop:9403 length:585 start_codon:yes stop_codon:yes gene_type:complete